MKTVRGDATEASEMRDAVMRRMTNRNFRRGIAVAMATMVFGWGGASAGADPQGANPADSPAATISRLDVAATAPGAEVRIEADAALVWTTFRDAAGRLVVEFPDSRPAAGVVDQAPESGLVAGVRVSTSELGSRPVTRVTVETREATEHRLDADGNLVRIQLMRAAGHEELAVSPEVEESEPVAAATAAAAPAETLAAAAPAVGTADRPLVAPPPTGAPATRLEGLVQVDSQTVRIAGDGEFAYSTFRLENPERFVIDLDGVFNASDRSTLPVGGAEVDQVRVSQFRTDPLPVSRVVFDLATPAVPRIDRTPGGLVVRFGDGESLAEEIAAAPQAVPAVVVDAPAPVTLPATPAPAASRLASAPATVADFEAADMQQDDSRAMVTSGAPVEAPRTLASIEAGQTLTGAKKEYFGEPISMTLRDADVREVLRSFARISGLNVVIQPGVKGTVTVELERVPWDQALDQILKINNLGYELDGNIMRIAPVEVLEQEARRAQALQQAQALSIPLRTVVKRLSYSTAGEIAGLLSRGGAEGILSQRGTVIIDARTNTLVIKELPSYMDTVLAVIDTLDVPEPQVMIEAKIIETTKQFSRSLGIRWGFEGIADAAHGNSTTLQFPNHGTVDGGVGLLTGGANGFIDMTLGNILDTFSLNARLQAAESEGLVTVLSAPKISTLNNNSASIQSGVQLPIQTVANNTVTVQFVNATLRLDVTPHVTAEGTILMDINVQKREPQLAFIVPGASNAPISTKEARTRVIVRDGGTTVIGGIYKVSNDNGQDRVPGLSNVPLLGHLFKNRRMRNENDEMLIFITPRVIKL
jgi:type IV pilus assembly protein PilQ